MMGLTKLPTRPDPTKHTEPVCESEHFRRIHKHWNRLGWRTARKAWWDLLDYRGFDMPTTALFTIMLVPFDMIRVGLNIYEWYPETIQLITRLSPPQLAVILAVVGCATAWFWDRYLSFHTPRECRLPRWLRLVRQIGVFIPWLAYFLVCWWKKLMTRPPTWLQAHVAAAETAGGAPRRPNSLFARFLTHESLGIRGKGWLSIVVYVLSLAFYGLPTIWLTADAQPDPLKAAVFLPYTYIPRLFCVLGFLFLFHRLADEQSAWHLRLKRVRFCLLVFWLVPVPFLWVLTGIFIVPLERKESMPSSPLHRVFTARSGVGWQNHWTGLGFGMSDVARFPFQPSAELVCKEDRYVKSLYRVKVVLMFVETAGLVWILSRILGPGQFQPLFEDAFVTLVTIAMAGFFGHCGFIFYLAWRFGRKSMPPARGRDVRLMGRYAGLACIFCPAGVMVGGLIAIGANKYAGIVLVMFLLLSLFTIFIDGAVPVFFQNEAESAVAEILACLWIFLGLGVAFLIAWLPGLAERTAWWMALQFLAALLFNWIFLNRLVHWYGRSAMTLIQIGDTDEAAGVRRRLRMATRIAYLPLGGLLAPLLVHLRARNREALATVCRRMTEAG